MAMPERVKAPGCSGTGTPAPARVQRAWLRSFIRERSRPEETALIVLTVGVVKWVDVPLPA